VSVMLSEHLPLLTGAPDGIQKLRGLILELAVRGKLVPQDPNDEPASELLKRIAKERARLEAEGARNKSKTTPLGNDAEVSFDLPGGWKWVRFEEIAQHNSGKTLDKGRNSGEPRPYITTSNLYWGRFELGSVRQMLMNEDELERCTARKNDLLICEGGEAGRAAVWPHDDEICFQNHVHRARFFGGIDPYFAYRFFEKLNASGEIDQYRKGVGISNMSGKSLASIPFPVPPLAEQHRIVAKVDELMALCVRLEAEQTDATSAHAKLVETLLGTLTQSRDAFELAANWLRLSQHFDTLFSTETSLDVLKQTILQLAVMGKLVPQVENDEPASELLKRIDNERARLEAEGACKKLKPAPPLDEDEQRFALPKGWQWTRAQEAFDVRDGTHDTPKYVERNGVPLITSRNFIDGKISFEEAKLISLADHEAIKKRSGVSRGDILYSMIGGNIGNQVIVDTEREFSIKNVALFKYYRQEDTLPLFLNLFLKTVTFGLKQNANGGAQPFVALSLLRNIPVALPPVAEQHRIVAKVDELMALCDRLKADLAEARTRQARLSTTLIDAALKAA
jgi:type I restriction enzyme S subunit